MVADRIVVESRSATAGADEAVRWTSAGDGSYQTEQIARAQRGTTITLHLKDDAHEFGESYRLRSLIKKYSDFVNYPVMMPKVIAEPKEGEEPEEPGDEQSMPPKPCGPVQKTTSPMSNTPNFTEVPAASGTSRPPVCISMLKAPLSSPACSLCHHKSPSICSTRTRAV